VPDADIERTAAATAGMCAPGATVVWTRHRRPPDLTPQVQEWFEAAGCTTLGFWSGGPGGFGVGAARFDGAARPLDRSRQLFTFTSG
jgi:hypothetical protein